MPKFMKAFKNIIFQYSLASLAAVLTVTLILSYFLTQGTKAHLIDMHLQLFSDIVQNEAKGMPEIYEFFLSPPGSSPPQNLDHYITELTSFGDVFRIKLWGPEAVILWSDETRIIGRRYPDNQEYHEAWKGKVAYEIAATHKTEQATEAGRGPVLEIYVPLKNEGRVIGIVELYEASETLWIEIDRHTRLIWLMMGLAGLVLYLLLFFIFYRAQKRIKDADHRLIRTQDVTIYALAFQAGMRDLETGRHLDRTSTYVEILARELKKTPAYKGYLTEEYLRDLVQAAPLHDIGKVGIPDSILLKPGPLTPEEREIMQKHCDYGAMVLRKAEGRLSFHSFLSIGIQIAHCHHEKWDGSGYPQGLKGENIPISARIMALADVYDALRSARPYKQAFEHERSRDIIVADRGRHFDPAVIEAFLAREEDFLRISVDLADQLEENNQQNRPSLDPTNKPPRPKE